MQHCQVTCSVWLIDIFFSCVFVCVWGSCLILSGFPSNLPLEKYLRPKDKFHPRLLRCGLLENYENCVKEFLSQLAPNVNDGFNIGSITTKTNLIQNDTVLLVERIFMSNQPPKHFRALDAILGKTKKKSFPVSWLFASALGKVHILFPRSGNLEDNEILDIA